VARWLGNRSTFQKGAMSMDVKGKPDRERETGLVGGLLGVE
jgi:hypothetical protein